MSKKKEVPAEANEIITVSDNSPVESLQRFAKILSVKFIALIISFLFLLPVSASSEAQVKEALNKFVTAIGKDPQKYSIMVEENEINNAYATLGKKIVIYTGLIDNLEADVALDFVVAHELGHIEERHLINGMARRGLFSFLGSLFSKRPRVSEVYNGVAYLGNLHYSRGAEKEADLFAVKLMNELYCDKEGKLEFFERSMGHEKESRLTEYFSTHPLSSRRLEYLKGNIEAAGCKI